MVSIPSMIRPVPVSRSYRASVAAATLAMIAAPFVYAAFVAVVACLVGLWAVYGVILATNFFTIAIYVAVFGAGLTVLFFLGKVFFSPPKMDAGFTPIDLAAHPELAGLIHRVCEATGAPHAAEVAVDMSLNGAASLIHPIWGLFNNRYRLTLGLPLVAISDQQHMAHVIAHEVGHFSQGGAMRVRQLIHWSQYYLHQLVDGRDRWDVLLASQSAGSPTILRMIASVAGVGVRLSRHVLRLLLRGTLLVNARMSREMEFHADLFAIRVAGTAAFFGSVETFAAGAAAMQKAMQIAHRGAAEGRYPEDFAALTAACYAMLTPEERREIARQGRYTIGLGYDSHPDDTDRLERAGLEHDEGVLDEHGPASALFPAFQALCRAQSLRFYEVEPKELVPATVLLAEDEHRDSQDAGRIGFFGAVYDGPVWLRIGETDPVNDAAWPGVIAAGDECRSATLGFFQTIVAAYSKWVTSTVVLRRLEARMPVDWMRLELEPCDIETARSRMYRLDREHAAASATFHQVAAPLRRRLTAAWTRRTLLAPERETLFAQLYEGIRAMEAADEPTTKLAVDLAVLTDLGSAINENLQNPEFMQIIQSEFEAAMRHAQQLEEVLRNLVHPLTGTGDLLAVARPRPMDPDGGVYGYLTVYGGALSWMRDLRLRVMGQLAELALEVEATRAPAEESLPR
ncbi:MAG: M48 family metalloprotease [Acidobacteria bacterium]|nr:M48 family metalloprotease [Acidobacteriota bacterium]